MTYLFETILRLGDGSTVPITLRVNKHVWSVVRIGDKPPRVCKRGHIVIWRNAAQMRNGYIRCRECERRRRLLASKTKSS